MFWRSQDPKQKNNKSHQHQAVDLFWMVHKACRMIREIREFARETDDDIEKIHFHNLQERE
jgi:hypothetical protein